MNRARTPNASSRRTLVQRTAVGLAAALAVMGAAAAPAFADNNRHRGWQGGYYYGPPGHAKHHKWHRHARPYVYPAPVYAYAPPPVVYVPAPVYRPQPSVTVVIPFDF